MSDLSSKTNAELWQLGHEGDEDALTEIEARGYEPKSFLRRPLEEFF